MDIADKQTDNFQGIFVSGVGASYPKDIKAGPSALIQLRRGICKLMSMRSPLHCFSYDLNRRNYESILFA